MNWAVSVTTAPHIDMDLCDIAMATFSTSHSVREHVLAGSVCAFQCLYNFFLAHCGLALSVYGEHIWSKKKTFLRGLPGGLEAHLIYLAVYHTFTAILTNEKWMHVCLAVLASYLVHGHLLVCAPTVRGWARLLFCVLANICLPPTLAWPSTFN